MADIPNRNTIFPNWAKVTQTNGSSVATIEAPEAGRASTARRTDVPAVSTDRLMNLIGISIPSDLWSSVDKVVINGNEYAEQIVADVPAGKEVEINAGQKWSIADDETRTKFLGELPDDAIFSAVEEGGKLKVHMDRTAHSDLLSAGQPDGSQYQMGGNNFLIVSGQGDVEAYGGDFGDNFDIEAESSTVDMGEGELNFYRARGESSGHHVTGGLQADTFDYDFRDQGDDIKDIGTNTFNAGVGSTGVNKTDQVQLRGLPNGYTVQVDVTSVSTAGGIFPDTDSVITIRDPQGNVKGTIETVNNNYIFLINDDGALTQINPSQIGAGGSRSYTVSGNDRPLERAAEAPQPLLADKEREGQEGPVSPRDLANITAKSDPAAEKG